MVIVQVRPFNAPAPSDGAPDREIPARSAAPPSTPVECARATPHPCMGSRANVRRISKSSVPGSRSVDGGAFLPDTQQEHDAVSCRMSRGKAAWGSSGKKSLHPVQSACGCRVLDPIRCVRTITPATTIARESAKYTIALDRAVPYPACITTAGKEATVSAPQ